MANPHTDVDLYDQVEALEQRCARLERIIERLAINTGTTVESIEKLIDLIAKGEA